MNLRPYPAISGARALLVLLILCCSWTKTSAQSGGERAQPSKARRTVVVLGHADHGKSTLTAAITGVLSDRGEERYVPYDEIAYGSVITVQGVKVTAAQVEYETGKARYVQIDCQNNEGILKLLSSEQVKLDGAILVVSAADGPMPQTREHLQAAGERGLKSLIVYLNKVDLVDDPELLQLVELEVRELLTAAGFEGDDVPFIRGSALMALSRMNPDIGESSILALLRAMDSAFVH